MESMDDVKLVLADIWSQFRDYSSWVQAMVAFFVIFFTYYIYWRLREKSHKFNSYTTAKQAMGGKDLSGKVAIVTGCNTGIGKETAKIMAEHGCKVIMACRTPSKAEAAKADIIKELSHIKDIEERLVFMKLDLSSLKSVYDFAKEFARNENVLDYLVNNAGVMALPDYRESTDGFEMQFATNVLGHFYLTELLVPHLRQSKFKSGIKSRVINVSSGGHRMGVYDKTTHLFEHCIAHKCFMGDLKNTYGDLYNYGISKLSNILHARELQRHYGQDIIAVSLHPGSIVGTELARDTNFFSLAMLEVMGFLVTHPGLTLGEFKSVPQGAATSIRCVAMSDEEIQPGAYYTNCRVIEEFEFEGALKDKREGNHQLGRKLWTLCNTLLESKKVKKQVLENNPFT